MYEYNSYITCIVLYNIMYKFDSLDAAKRARDTSTECRKDSV